MVLPAIVGMLGRGALGGAARMGGMAASGIAAMGSGITNWVDPGRHPAQGSQRALGPLRPAQTRPQTDDFDNSGPPVPFERIYEQADQDSVKSMVQAALKVLTSIEATVKAQLTHQKTVAVRHLRMDREDRFEGRRQDATKEGSGSMRGEEGGGGGMGMGGTLIGLTIAASLFAEKLQAALDDFGKNFAKRLGGLFGKAGDKAVETYEEARETVKDIGVRVGSEIREKVGEVTGGALGADPAHKGHADRKRKPGGGNKAKAQRELMTYNSFRKAGFSHEGTLALAAEVGRENSFRPNVMYGPHTDAGNSATNIGIFSFQGSRYKALMAFMKKRGLVNKDGKSFKPGQASLDAMAEFIAEEMKSRPQNRELFELLRQNHVDPEEAARLLGHERKGYIQWDMDGSTLTYGALYGKRHPKAKQKLSDADRRKWVEAQHRNRRDHYAETMAAANAVGNATKVPPAPKKKPKSTKPPTEKPNSVGEIMYRGDGTNWVSEDGVGWKPYTGPVPGEDKSDKLKPPKKTSASSINNNNTTNIVAPGSRESQQMASLSPPNPNAGWGKDYHTAFGTQA